MSPFHVPIPTLMNLSPWWSFTTGKAPGPASIPIECFRLMPHPVKKILLTHYNDCFLKLAKVVMIFKSTNKNSRHPSSYRPDSLANSIYKIYAAMLQQRLCKAIDPLLQPNQFGFRPQRSLAAPLFLIRRPIEIFEWHTTSLYILFRDWSQAFDSIGHAHVQMALQRYGATPILFRLSGRSTTKPNFRFLNQNSNPTCAQSIAVFASAAHSAHTFSL